MEKYEYTWTNLVYTEQLVLHLSLTYPSQQQRQLYHLLRQSQQAGLEVEVHQQQVGL